MAKGSSQQEAQGIAPKVALALEKVTAGYGKKELFRDLTLRIQGGEFVGIIGPNGAGKTSLLRVMTGWLSPWGGQVLLRGRELDSYTALERGRLLACLCQERTPLLPLTVAELLALSTLPGRNCPDWHRQQVSRLEEVREKLGLSELAPMAYDTLSGGQKQRVQIARVLAQNTPIVLLDEPTAHLDYAWQQELMELLARWWQEYQLTIVLCCHDFRWVEQYASRLLLLHQGRLLREGAPSQVLSSPELQVAYNYNCSSKTTLSPLSSPSFLEVPLR